MCIRDRAYSNPSRLGNTKFNEIKWKSYNESTQRAQTSAKLNPSGPDPDDFQNLMSTTDTSLKKIHEDPLSFTSDMNQIVENVLSRSVEECFRIPGSGSGCRGG